MKNIFYILHLFPFFFLLSMFYYLFIFRCLYNCFYYFRLMILWIFLSIIYLIGNVILRTKVTTKKLNNFCLQFTIRIRGAFYWSLWIIISKLKIVNFFRFIIIIVKWNFLTLMWLFRMRLLKIIFKLFIIGLWCQIWVLIKTSFLNLLLFILFLAYICIL